MKRNASSSFAARDATRRLAPPAFDATLLAAAPVHRRAFLGWLGAGALTALPARTARGVTALLTNGGPLMLDQVTHATFVEVLGGSFQMEVAPGRTTEAKLIEVNPLGQGRAPGASDRREPFSVLFRAPPGLALAQCIYALEHPKLGRLDVFLVPIRQDSEGLVLEAVFN